MSTYTCITCIEEITGKHILVGGDRLCAGCFETLFKMAINDEHHFPAHWGQLQLDHKQYLAILSPEIVSQYEAKTTEYACPPNQRVYCARTDPPRRPENCGNFVGQFTHSKTCIRCSKCMWYTCLRCEETFSTSDTEGDQAQIQHECDARREQDINMRALDGLEPGKEYQICPQEQCQRVWSLWDGCNHMKCTCGTHFCYICGVETGKSYRHWEQTNCPLYNSAPARRDGPVLEGPYANDAEALQDYRQRIRDYLQEQGWRWIANPFAEIIEQGRMHGFLVTLFRAPEQPGQLGPDGRLMRRRRRQYEDPEPEPQEGYWIQQAEYEDIRADPGLFGPVDNRIELQEIHWRHVRAPREEGAYRLIVIRYPEEDPDWVQRLNRPRRRRACTIM